MASQSGTGINIIADEPSNSYGTFDPIIVSNDTEFRDYRGVVANSFGLNVTQFNSTSDVYIMTVPAGYMEPSATFLEGSFELYKTDTAKMDEYDPADKLTHATIQNHALSLFSSIVVKHNDTAVETLNDPAKIATVLKIMEPYDVTHSNQYEDLCYVDRCTTYNGAGGTEFNLSGLTDVTATIGAGGAITWEHGTATTGTLSLVPTRNTTDYDPSFEARCKKTGGGRTCYFRIPLNFLAIFNRPIVTYVKGLTVEFARNTDNKIIENRTTGPIAIDSTHLNIKLTTLRMWCSYVKPTLSVESELRASIQNEEKLQQIGYRSVNYLAVNIPKSTEKQSHESRYAMRPSCVIVGIRRENITPSGGGAAVKIPSRLTWENANVFSIGMTIEHKPFPATPLQIKNWSIAECQRLYDMYTSVNGAKRQGFAPALSMEQFRNNYVLWCFELAGNAEGMLEPNKNGVEYTIDVDFGAGGIPDAGMMEIFTVYDRLYTLKGPEGIVDLVF